VTSSSLQRYQQSEVAGHSRLGFAHPLMRSSSTAESWHGNEVAVYSVRRSRLTLTAVSSGRVSRSSPVAPGLTNANQSDHPLLRFDPLQGLALGSLRPLSFTGGHLSWVFKASSAPRDQPATAPRFHPRVICHVRGSTPPSQPYFRPILSGLVSSRKHS
jgi:hypothetical protein